MDAQSVVLANGVTLVLDGDSITPGATIHQSTPSVAPPEGTASAVGGPVQLTVEGGQILSPVTLEFPYDPAQVPDGLDPRDVLAVVTAEDAASTWEEVPFAVDAARHVLVVETAHFSIWDLINKANIAIEDAFGWLQQGVGQLLSTRAGPPTCGGPGRGPLPGWVSTTVAPNDANGIVRACSEGEGDVAVIEMVNNRAYPMVVTYGAPVQWGWHDTPSSLGAALTTAMIEPEIGPNALLLPPLSRASIGVPKGTWSYAGFQAQPTRLTTAALIMSLLLDNVGGELAGRLAKSMGGECVSDYAIGSATSPAPDNPADLARLAQNVAGCLQRWLAGGGLTELTGQGARVGELDALFKAVKLMGAVGLGTGIGAFLTPLFDLFVGDKGLWPVPMSISRRAEVASPGPPGTPAPTAGAAPAPTQGSPALGPIAITPREVTVPSDGQVHYNQATVSGLLAGEWVDFTSDPADAWLPGQADGAGNRPMQFQCFSTDAGRSWTVVATGRATRRQAAMRLNCAGAAPPATPAPTVAGPTVVVITVNNTVLHGTPGWVEDPNQAPVVDDPAKYRTVDGFVTYPSGQQLPAHCYTYGARLTDGNDAVASDDPWQFTSALHYGVTVPDGRRGYISAVWTTKREDSLGLPRC